MTRIEETWENVTVYKRLEVKFVIIANNPKIADEMREKLVKMMKEEKLEVKEEFNG